MPILRTKDETRWQVAILKQGEHVFIPPGIIHFDITIEDAFIVGGYFYNFECAPQTLEAIVCEHFLTDEERDEAFNTSPIILFKMLEDVLIRIEKLREGRSGM